MNNSIFKKLLAFFLMLAVVFTMTNISGNMVYAKSSAKIVLKSSKATVNVGKSFTVKVDSRKTSSSIQKKGYTFKSSNTKVATVNSKGVVKGKKAGKATITVYSKKSKRIKATCSITVKKASNSEVVVYQVYCPFGEDLDWSLKNGEFFLSGAESEPIRTAKLSDIKNKIIGDYWKNLSVSSKSKVNYKIAKKCEYSYLGYVFTYNDLGEQASMNEYANSLGTCLKENANEEGGDFVVLVYVKNNEIIRISSIFG